MRRATGRALLNALIVAALLAELIALVGHALLRWGTPSYPPTPAALEYQPPVPPSGADVLLRLSAVAASRTSEPWNGATPFAYVKVQSWHLRTKAPQTRLLPAVSQSWRRPRDVPALTPSPSALARLLATGSREGSTPGWAFMNLVRLTDGQPVPSAVQSILLRLLSRIADLINSGTAIDRAGRVGAAVSLESGYTGEPITYTLVFNPSTGALLEADETLAGPPHRLNALKGSVIAYTTFLGSGYVVSRGTTP